MAALTELQAVVKEINLSKSQDIAITRSLFDALSHLVKESKTMDVAALTATPLLTALEEIITGKFIFLTKSLQSQVVSVYEIILGGGTPGYTARSVLTNLMAASSNKLLSMGARECAITVIGNVVSQRLKDCGSMANDVMSCFLFIIKNNEILLKAPSLQAISSIAQAAESKHIDCFVDVIKTASKLMTDRQIDVRIHIAQILLYISRIIPAVAEAASDKPSATPVLGITTDGLLLMVFKGLEDENAAVQDAFSTTACGILAARMEQYTQDQETIKLNATRGTEAETTKSPTKRFSSLGSMGKGLAAAAATALLQQKKVIADYDYRTVITHLLKLIARPTVGGNPSNRAACLLTLSKLIKATVNTTSTVDFEWLLQSLMDLTRDNNTYSISANSSPSNFTMSVSPAAPVSSSVYITFGSMEESLYFRTRMSHVFRTAITPFLTETQQLGLVRWIAQYISSMDIRSDAEIVVLLQEAAHAVVALGEATASVAADLHTACVMQLRSACFAIRSASATVLCNISTVVASLGAKYTKEAMESAKVLMQQLMGNLDSLDLVESDYLSNNSSTDLTTLDKPSGAAASVAPSGAAAAGIAVSTTAAAPTTSRRKRTSLRQDSDNNRKMHSFHGHVLFLALTVKWLPKISAGIPQQRISDLFDLGVELLLQDIRSVTSAVRPVMCILVRSGSLILSGCVSQGYSVLDSRLLKLTEACDTLLLILRRTNALSATKEDLQCELMVLEAVVTTIAAVLWYCPEVLIFESSSLSSINNILSTMFTLMKERYSAPFRSSIRFRTCHAMVLECYSMLPPSSYPLTANTMYAEATRLFRDLTLANVQAKSNELSATNTDDSREYACNSMLALCPWHCSASFMPSTITNAIAVADTAPANEDLLMLMLEQHTKLLHTREFEYSSAFNYVNIGINGSPTDVDYLFGTDNQLSTCNTESGRSLLKGAAPWSDPKFPCFSLDTRTFHASVAILTSTFDSQSLEDQQALIQLCCQSNAQMLKLCQSGQSTTDMLFTSEEDKRKRDRKVLAMTYNSTHVLGSVISAFPFANSTSELVWVQPVVDKLFERLVHPHSSIKIAAARALSDLAVRFTDSCLLEDLATKISIILTGALLEKKQTEFYGVTSPAASFYHMGDHGGYLIMLSNLWSIGGAQPHIQQSITNAIFDCLKRVDTAMPFRASGIYALSIIVSNRIAGNDSVTIKETTELLEKTCHVIETHLVCSTPIANASVTSSTSSTDYNYNCAKYQEYELLLFCIQRLINAVVPIVTQLDQSIAAVSISRLAGAWKVIIACATHDLVLQESLEFVCLMGSIPTSFVCVLESIQLVKTILWSKRTSSYVVLLSFCVSAIRAIILSDCSLAYEHSLDRELFLLLDWCLASQSSEQTASSGYTGLEFSCSYIGFLQNGHLLKSNKSKSELRHLRPSIQSLQVEVEHTLVAFVECDIRQSPYTHVVRWTLFCRGMALGLGASAVLSAPQDVDERAPEEADGSHFSSDPSATTTTTTTTTLPILASYHKDAAIGRCSGIPATRYRLKTVALMCASVVLSTVCGASSDSSMDSYQCIDADISRSRELTVKHLAEYNSSVSNDKSLCTVPTYLCLYLNDIMNMACACVTYTIDDVRITSIQCIATRYLQTIVSHYWNTLDPDHNHEDIPVSASNGPQDGVLVQFIAPVISAVRQCLSTNFCPLLSYTASSIMVSLIKGRLINDPVVIKRLTKLYLAHVSSISTLNMVSLGGTGGTPSLVFEDTAADSTVCIDNVVTGLNTAKLYLITLLDGDSKSGKSIAMHKKGNGNEVGNALKAQFQDNLQRCHDIWFALAVDAIRVMRGFEEIRWPGGVSPSCDYGVMYSHHVPVESIKPYLNAAFFPVVSAATYSLSSVSSTNSRALFAMLSFGFLQHKDICKKNNTNKHEVCEHDAGALLRALTHICELETFSLVSASKISSGDINQSIPVSQWYIVLEEACHNLHTTEAGRILHDNSLPSTSLSTTYVAHLLEFCDVLVRKITEALSDMTETSVDVGTSGVTEESRYRILLLQLLNMVLCCYVSVCVLFTPHLFCSTTEVGDIGLFQCVCKKLHLLLCNWNGEGSMLQLIGQFPTIESGDVCEFSRHCCVNAKATALFVSPMGEGSDSANKDSLFMRCTKGLHSVLSLCCAHSLASPGDVATFGNYVKSFALKCLPCVVLKPYLLAVNGSAVTATPIEMVVPACVPVVAVVIAINKCLAPGQSATVSQDAYMSTVAEVMEMLWRWSEAATKDVSEQSISMCGNVASAITAIWIYVVHQSFLGNTKNGQVIPQFFAIKLCDVFMNQSTVLIGFMTVVMWHLRQWSSIGVYVGQPNTALVRLVVTSVLPLVLTNLRQAKAESNMVLDVLYMQFVYVVYGIVVEARGNSQTPQCETLVDEMITVFCEYLSHTQSVEALRTVAESKSAPMSALVCGQILSKLAPAHNGLFRRKVMQLNDGMKELMQLSMRLAMMQQQENVQMVGVNTPSTGSTPVHTAAPTTGPSMKKLDFAKYKK